MRSWFRAQGGFGHVSLGFVGFWVVWGSSFWEWFGGLGWEVLGRGTEGLRI